MRGIAVYKRPPVKPMKYAFLDLMKALEGGNDSTVKTALLGMEVDEVEYLLVLTKRLEGLLGAHLRKKLRGFTLEKTKGRESDG